MDATKCIVALSLLVQTGAQAQTEEKKLSYDYPQKVVPASIDNYLFSTYYYSGKRTYNMRGLQMSQSAAVSAFRLSPAGSTFAVMTEKEVLVYHLWKSNKLVRKLDFGGHRPTALAYSPDSRQLAVATDDQTVTLYDTRDYQAQQRLECPFAAERLEISANNFFLAAAAGSRLGVWNLQSGQLRHEQHTEAAINDLDFGQSGALLGLLTADGRLTTYNTQSFELQQTYDALGDARSFYYHQDGKYAAVVTGDKRICILNLLNLRERDYVDHAAGGITELRFLKDGKNESYLAYNTAGSIVYTFMNQLSPYYTRLLADELNERMTEWLRQQPDETLAEYNVRVNDDTRAEQMMLFEREIATRLADNLIDRSQLTLGSYNASQHVLSLNFDTMPTIYLDVPEKDLTDFADPGQLEFRNAVYGLNAEDRFELIYADVYNKKNGQTYVFDNLARQSLAYLENDENFVPLSIVQQSNAEEMKLQEIKQGIIDLAKKNKQITDNTEISVSATAERAVNADGQRITNYNISFAYQIDQRFSSREDFAPGRYRIEESPAAMSMLAIVKAAFSKDMAQYIVPGKQLKVSITGMADAAPISRPIAYDGCYGEFDGEPVRKDGNLMAMNVSRQDGIATNEQLAFLRALGVRDFIEKNVGALKQMDCDYQYNIELATKTGGQFRRISVVFTFIDAFDKSR